MGPHGSPVGELRQFLQDLSIGKVVTAQVLEGSIIVIVLVSIPKLDGGLTVTTIIGISHHVQGIFTRFESTPQSMGRQHRPQIQMWLAQIDPEMPPKDRQIERCAIVRNPKFCFPGDGEKLV